MRNAPSWVGRVDLTAGMGDPGADCTDTWGSARSSPRWWARLLPPLIPAPAPVPVPVVLASYTGQVPTLAPMGNKVDPSIPSADPIPPVPGTTRLLTAAEQQ